jgi:hypothetical protein
MLAARQRTGCPPGFVHEKFAAWPTEQRLAQYRPECQAMNVVVERRGSLSMGLEQSSRTAAAAAVDLDRFRLRRFVEKLAASGDLETRTVSLVGNTLGSRKRFSQAFRRACWKYRR